MMAKNKQQCEKYDLSSIQCIFTGAAPLGQETADDLKRIWPNWYIRQGYGISILLPRDSYESDFPQA